VDQRYRARLPDALAHLRRHAADRTLDIEQTADAVECFLGQGRSGEVARTNEQSIFVA